MTTGCCAGGCACSNSGCVSGRSRSRQADLLNLGRDQGWAWYRRASKEARIDFLSVREPQLNKDDLGAIGILLGGRTGGHATLQFRALGGQQSNSTATRF